MTERSRPETFFDAVGGEQTFVDLVHRFYAGVASDPTLRALYPEERSHRLDSVIARHGYRVANRHRAYDDAEVLYKFYHDNLDQFGEDYFYPIAQQLVRYA